MMLTPGRTNRLFFARDLGTGRPRPAPATP
jgi:hypothetical protein